MTELRETALELEIHELKRDLEDAWLLLSTAELQRDSALYQIERAIAQLESVEHVTFFGHLGEVETVVQSVLAQLKLFHDHEK